MHRWCCCPGIPRGRGVGFGLAESGGPADLRGLPCDGDVGEGRVRLEQAVGLSGRSPREAMRWNRLVGVINVVLLGVMGVVSRQRVNGMHESLGYVRA